MLVDQKTLNPKLDLFFETHSKLSIEQIWNGWTGPSTLVKWFCPRPWKVTDCRIDLRHGGEFYTMMEGPGGEKAPNNGCFLEIIPNHQLVWTNMMTAGFRPSKDTELGFPFVAKIALSDDQNGCLYQAHVFHRDEIGRKKHEEMGFQEGWALAFKQLEECFHF